MYIYTFFFICFLDLLIQQEFVSEGKLIMDQNFLWLIGNILRKNIFHTQNIRKKDRCIFVKYRDNLFFGWDDKNIDFCRS